jgi:hypothetical protein
MRLYDNSRYINSFETSLYQQYAIKCPWTVAKEFSKCFAGCSKISDSTNIISR